MEYREASIQDIDELVMLRKRQLADEGIKPDIKIDDELAAYFTKHLNDASLVEWLVEDDGSIIATAAIVFMEFPPTYTNRTGVKGYITNKYTNPLYRGKGIATKMLDKLVLEARTRGVKKIWLGASEMGRPVYEKFGFIETNECMELTL